MLTITQRLIDHIHCKDQTGQPLVLSSSYIHTILKCGSIQDAEALLTTFMEQPADYERAYLLPVLGQFGNASIAQTLFERCFDANGLKANMPEALLQVVGQLRYYPAADIICSYALIEKNDYYASMYGVLGLLHFSCAGYEQQIEAAIRNTFDKNIFNEFVPSLVCKLPNRKELLPLLYKHGSGICSTDCNAGILLGFALSGEEGAGLFRQALFDQDWEVYASGTGTRYWASVGMPYAGVGFKELYTHLLQEVDEKKLAYKLLVFEGLLTARLGQVENPLVISGGEKESLASIFEWLFGWETPNRRNNILDVAEKAGERDLFDALEKTLQLKVEEELLVNSLKQF
jgi:hypothetical protein